MAGGGGGSGGGRPEHIDGPLHDPGAVCAARDVDNLGANPCALPSGHALVDAGDVDPVDVLEQGGRQIRVRRRFKERLAHSSENHKSPIFLLAPFGHNTSLTDHQPDAIPLEWLIRS